MFRVTEVSPLERGRTDVTKAETFIGVCPSVKHLQKGHIPDPS